MIYVGILYRKSETALREEYQVNIVCIIYYYELMENQ